MAEKHLAFSPMGARNASLELKQPFRRLGESPPSLFSDFSLMLFYY